MQKQKPDCLIIQNEKLLAVPTFFVWHEVETFKPYNDTVAITKVYLRPEYKQQLHDEQQNLLY